MDIITEAFNNCTEAGLRHLLKQRNPGRYAQPARFEKRQTRESLLSTKWVLLEEKDPYVKGFVGQISGYRDTISIQQTRGLSLKLVDSGIYGYAALVVEVSKEQHRNICYEWLSVLKIRMKGVIISGILDIHPGFPRPMVLKNPNGKFRSVTISQAIKLGFQWAYVEIK